MTCRPIVSTLTLLSTLVLALGPSSPAAGLATQEVTPDVTIEKATNGADADTGPGLSVDAGQSVIWTWSVTASGSAALFDIVVSDTGPVQPDCDIDGDGQPDGTNIHPGPLDPGQTLMCTATGGADLDPADGTFAAIGRVRATDFAATAIVEDTDASHHTPTVPFDPAPGVAVQAMVNGQVVDGHAAPLVAEGSPVTFTYVVTNTGNVPLTDISVSDQNGLPVDCGDGTSVVAGPLQPGASVTCTAVTTAANQAAGRQSSTAAVSAAAIDPASNTPLGDMRASDPAAYIPVKVAGALAFTGPDEWALPLGLALTAAGAALLGWYGAGPRPATRRVRQESVRRSDSR